MTNYLEKLKTTLTDQYNSKLEWAKNNQWKASTIGFIALALTVSTAAYYFSPRYASFVGACASKVSGFVAPALAAASSGITAAFTFAASHPIVFAALAVAVVATLVTLAIKNHDKSQEIKSIYKDINQAFEEKDGQVEVKDRGKARTLIANAQVDSANTNQQSQGT